MTTTRQLGRSDISVTPIGLGCVQFAGRGVATGFYRAIPQEQASAVVHAALDGGVNWFDTAEMYGGGLSERMLTTALLEREVAPADVTIATKWPPLLRRASHLTKSIGERQAALQGNPIDLYQLHMPGGALSSRARQVATMAELARSGAIRHVGVSNYSARQLTDAARQLQSDGLDLASNQVQISLLDRRIETNGVLEAARRLGVTLIAYAPLKSGLLTGRFHADPDQLRRVAPIRRILGGFTNRTLKRTAPVIEELHAIATAHGASIAQVALSWLIGFYGDTVIAIPGGSRPRHATESAGAMELELTKPELDRLDEVSRAAGALQ